MLIRIKETGQVQEFAPEFTAFALRTGIAEKVEAGTGSSPALERAAMAPSPETAMLQSPKIVRGPRVINRILHRRA